MKKKILLVITLIATMSIFTGCNKQLFDTEYSFEKALVSMPNGQCYELEIDSWTDFDGEQIQITTVDGKTYVINSVNCVLIHED